MKIKKILIIMLFLSFSLPIFSQYQAGYYSFYGKNKVIRERYKWKFIETDHFRIHYYTTKRDLINKILNTSERAYDKISNYLNVQVKKKIPLIFYETRLDFQLTNILNYVPVNAIAFAESNAFRVVIQGDASYDDLTDTIVHELGHIFEYEMMGRGIRFTPVPLWVTEGFSDFITGKWGDFDLLTVRDSIINGQTPNMTKNGNLVFSDVGGRSAYNFGHLVFQFLDEKMGRRGIKKLMYSLKRGSFLRRKRNVLSTLGYTPKSFNYEFGRWARKKFKKYVLKENPEDYSYIIGPDFPFQYSFSHQISKSGELLAILTVNRKAPKLDIVLISVKDGKVVKSTLPLIPKKYDYMNLKFNPADGNSFAWNTDTNKIAFFAQKEWQNYLIVVDVLSGKLIQRIKLKNIQDPTSLDFHPKNNDVLYFTGQDATKSFIFRLNLKEGKPEQITEGKLFIKSLNISSDGKKIVYSAKEDEYQKIYIGPIEKPEMAKKITDGEYNDITPVFSGDNKHIYYSSNELESFNIYSIDLENKIRYRFTDVKTGNFFPIEIPGDEKKIIISSFFKGSFVLFKKDITDYLEKQDIELQGLETLDQEKKTKVESDVEVAKYNVTKETVVKREGKYNPLKKLYIKNIPYAGVSYGTDGRLMGFTYLSMSDLMGDHNFNLFISSYYGYRSYHVSYLNMKNRLQYYSLLFYYNQVYNYGYYDYSSFYNTGYQPTLRSMYGGEGGIYYPFNRSHRLEATFSLYRQKENVYVGVPYGQFYTGMLMPLRLSLVGETTIFQRFGPLKGHTFNLTLKKFVKLGSTFIDSYSVSADFRKYFRLDNYTLLALRASGFRSGGKIPMLTWAGGNNTFRSAYFNSLIGNNAFLFNAEFRFPLIHAALTPLGIIGPIRGKFFFDFGGVWFDEQKFRVFKEGEGLKLEDALSSYGFGLEFYFLGYPMHVEWVWKTNWKQKRYYGVNFWIGYSF
jgi:WD40 repeat protein